MRGLYMCGYLVVETGSIEAHLSMGAFGTLHVLILVALGLQAAVRGTETANRGEEIP